MTGSCWCGRSESGLCTGLHKFSEAEYKKFLEEKDKPKEEKQPEIKNKLMTEISIHGRVEADYFANFFTLYDRI